MPCLPLVDASGATLTVCPGDYWWSTAVAAHETGTWRTPRRLAGFGADADNGRFSPTTAKIALGIFAVLVVIGFAHQMRQK